MQEVILLDQMLIGMLSSYKNYRITLPLLHFERKSYNWHKSFLPDLSGCKSHILSVQDFFVFLLIHFSLSLHNSLANLWHEPKDQKGYPLFPQEMWRVCVRKKIYIQRIHLQSGRCQELRLWRTQPLVKRTARDIVSHPIFGTSNRVGGWVINC